MIYTNTMGNPTDKYKDDSDQVRQRVSEHLHDVVDRLPMYIGTMTDGHVAELHGAIDRHDICGVCTLADQLVGRTGCAPSVAYQSVACVQLQLAVKL